MQYVDDEGDRVLLTTDNDLVGAVNTAKLTGLKVFIPLYLFFGVYKRLPYAYNVGMLIPTIVQPFRLIALHRRKCMFGANYIHPFLLFIHLVFHSSCTNIMYHSLTFGLGNF